MLVACVCYTYVVHLILVTCCTIVLSALDNFSEINAASGFYATNALRQYNLVKNGC